MKSIELQFKDRTIISLSGRDFGRKIYDEQIAKFMDGDTQVRLVFPPRILSVASSFAQGLLTVELEKLGLDYVQKKFSIYSDVKGFEKKFWESFE